MAQLQDDSGLDQEIGNKWMDSNTGQQVDPQDSDVDGSKEQGRRSGQECTPHFLLYMLRLAVETFAGSSNIC